jgi:group I intron endonuclease
MVGYSVYKHTNKINGKVYIGITSKPVEQRWKNGRGYHNTKSHFSFAIKKYGWNNFEHEIVATNLSRESACLLEQELILKYNSTNRQYGYNMTFGGESNIPTDEVRQKLSVANSGENSFWWGKCHTEETKDKMRKACIGDKNHWYGKKLSDETKRKMSESHTGIKSPVARSVICLNTNEVFITINDAAKKYDVDNPSISACCLRKRKSVGGYNWLYYDEYQNMTQEEIQNYLIECNTNDTKRKVVNVITGEIFEDQTIATNKYGIAGGAISRCCSGKLKSAGKHPVTGEKLKWMYYEDYLKCISEGKGA